jgi:hypothetical protein
MKVRCENTKPHRHIEKEIRRERRHRLLRKCIEGNESLANSLR